MIIKKFCRDWIQFTTFAWRFADDILDVLKMTLERKEKESSHGSLFSAILMMCSSYACFFYKLLVDIEYIVCEECIESVC